jgi:hypothetical protein
VQQQRGINRAMIVGRCYAPHHFFYLVYRSSILKILYCIEILVYNEGINFLIMGLMLSKERMN